MDDIKTIALVFDELLNMKQTQIELIICQVLKVFIGIEVMHTC